jgi:hypothetical protein
MDDDVSVVVVSARARAPTALLAQLPCCCSSAAAAGTVHVHVWSSGMGGSGELTHHDSMGAPA